MRAQLNGTRNIFLIFVLTSFVVAGVLIDPLAATVAGLVAVLSGTAILWHSGAKTEGKEQ